MSEDFTRIEDELQDLNEVLGELVVAVEGREPPKVHVTSPPVTVNVPAQAPPVVNVPRAIPHAWSFTVTKRDNEGKIVSFTATPTTR